MWLFLKNVAFLVLVQGTAAVYVPLYVLTREPFSLDGFRWLGLIALIAGAIDVLWCDWDFWRQGRGTPAPIDAPKVLVIRGLYRRVRNPMYIGVLFVLVGEAVLFASWAIAIYAWLAAAAFHLVVVLYEEPALRDKFGAAYEEYLKRVPRWIPRF